MSENLIKILQDVGIDKDKINDVLSAMEVTKKKRPDAPSSNVDSLVGQVTAIKLAMDKETDWRKKAELAARIISLELDV